MENEEKSPFAGKLKRKSGKKSRFITKAKKFAKQGKLGRGFEVDTDTYNYFLRVLELSQKNEFDTPDEKEAFINNSFGQTENLEVNLSSNQMTSRVIESLLPSANENILIRFTSAFTPSLRIICSDPFASHVLEKLLEVTSSDKWSKSIPLVEWFRQTSLFVLNNFEEFTFDNYANHVMRKVCQCCCGLVIQSGQGSLQGQQQGNKKSLISSENDAQNIFGERKKNNMNEEMLKEFYFRFMNWPQFYDLFKTELTCGFVQNLLKTYHRMDSEDVQKGITTTIKALGDELDLQNPIMANLYTRTIEVCLSLTDEKGWKKIYKQFFRGKLSIFGIHEKGKFCLKKLFDTCPNKDKFEAIFDELEPELVKLWETNHTSVFVSIAEGCRKFQTKQSQFLQCISSILETSDSKEIENKPIKKEKKNSDEDDTGSKKNTENFILCMARFGKKMLLKEDGTPMFMTDFSGTMVLQQLMEFHKPVKIVSSIMEMNEKDLIKLTQDPKGSHIVDSFFKSLTIGDKNKEKLLIKLQEHLTSLALNKFGSRVIDTIWSWASMKQKGILASSLCTRIAQLNANPFGKFIAEKCALHSYKLDPKEWASSFEKVGKRKQDLEHLANELGLTDTPPSKKSKKNRHLIAAEEDDKTTELGNGSEIYSEDIVNPEEDTPRKKKKKDKKSKKQASLED